jgi:hypothetical protein
VRVYGSLTELCLEGVELDLLAASTQGHFTERSPVEDAIRRVPGVADASVNLAGERPHHVRER